MFSDTFYAKSMICVYRILFFPALFFMLPYYLLRMWRRGGYGDGFSQRFGAVNLPAKGATAAGKQKKRVWLQAVSVGEMQAITPLLQALKARGDVEVYLTTTTSTGHRIAMERYGGEKAALATGVVGVGYFPLDWWAFSARAWRHVRPDLVILMEGERWPEHIAQARKRSVPVLAVNARLSDRSFSRMKAWRWAALPLMQRGITRVLACSEIDAERFRELGFSAEQVVVTGNIKWDVTIPLMSAEEKAGLRKEVGLGGSDSGELILLGSSTWPGEEEACVAALRAVRAAGVAARLLIVPRHMERRAEVEALLEREGKEFSRHFRSRGTAGETIDIAVGDTTGELRKFTQLADLVFVGKSLGEKNTEGQTPVEAAALGRAIMFGPGMSNFREISARLIKAGAALVVKDREELCATAVRIMGDVDARKKMMAASEVCYRGNQGAVARTVGVMEKALCASVD